MKRHHLVIFAWLISVCSEVVSSQNIVRNTEPAHGYLALRTSVQPILVESDTEEEKIFRQIQEIIVDRQEHIYVRDIGKISKFNANGHFEGTLGRMGQGPGEFSAPNGLALGPQGQILVLDQSVKIIIYGPDGAYVDSKQLKVRLHAPIIVDDDMNIFGFSRRIDESGVVKSLILTDMGGDFKEVDSFPELDARIKRSQKGGIAGGMKHPLSRDAFICRWAERGLCYGMNLEYRLCIFDFDGNHIQTITNSEKPAAIGKEKKALEDKFGQGALGTMHFPETVPFFGNLLSDEKGRLHVMRTRLLTKENLGWAADVYDRAGHFIFRTHFPFNPCQFHKDSFFSYGFDDAGKAVIYKVKILNFESLPF